jgi:hypothetical protein
MATPAEVPPALSTAIALVDDAVTVGACHGPLGVGYHDAWTAVRQAALASVAPATSTPPPADLETEARAVLERFAGAIAGLEPSVESAMGIGVAAASALVHLGTLATCALARIARDVDAADHLLATPTPELLTGQVAER